MEPGFNMVLDHDLAALKWADTIVAEGDLRPVLQWVEGNLQRNLTVDDIAATCGFGSAAALRQHFTKLVGSTPSKYRATFSSVPAGSVG